ncbi:hypothetical protein GALMADRAFT_209893 [Galerina marginata CBS 339.88]|uniref:Uncharacterized protein n=1 Tax=Galerina marginata (strain CBS 339.88) TaxID=685588 RepID=A0A067T334_GALM3|nr:hypothetical protein GALMADRAFT_209893 [Galerina marginata CBS 339.88]
MPRTFYSPEAYADELSFLNSELGYALFHPGLLGAHQPVAIGDIGTIQGGSFIRFFNAFRQATDEINRTDTGTPAEFKPVSQVNQRVNNNDASYSPGVFGSKGVTQMSLDAGAGLTRPVVPGADISTRFRIAFTKESDVALMTKWKSKASNAVFIQPLAEYFLRNHQRFLDHIRGAHGSATIRSDELVFVTATLMTGDWVMARASTGSEEFNLGFDCNYAGVGGGHVQWNYTSTLTSVLPSREGPDRPPSFDYSVTPQFDQCIFLKRLRIFDRSVFSWLKRKLLLSAADSVEGDLQRLHLKKKISDDNDQSSFGTNAGAVSLKTNLLVVYIFEEGTEAEDVADALETSFKNGNVFIEILSEISQEIGKKVNNPLVSPAPTQAPDVLVKVKQILLESGLLDPLEATPPKAAATKEMTAPETLHRLEANPPTESIPPTEANAPPESSEFSEAASEADPAQTDGASKSRPTTYTYVTDNRNVFNNENCRLDANVMIINNQPGLH